MTIRISRGVALLTASFVALLAAGASADQEAPRAAPTTAERVGRITRVDSQDVLAMIGAVDESLIGKRPAPAAPASWQHHVLRGTGSTYYVPFTFEASQNTLPEGPGVIYVRLATRRDAQNATLEESALADWLEAGASRPLPPMVRGFISVPMGEMPVGGPALSLARSQVAVSAQESFTVLALNLRELEKEDEARREAEEKVEANRKLGVSFVFPFEDFDLIERRPGAAAGTRLDRALVAPPGRYTLFVAIGGRASAAKRDAVPAVTVFRQDIDLPEPGLPGLGVSDIVLARSLSAREAAVPPDQQSANPYAFGTLQVVPARDTEFRDADSLSVVFQVSGALPDFANKPDVTVAYRFMRLDEGKEQLFAETAPQLLNSDTLPEPLGATGQHFFTTQSVSLETFAGGDYRLDIEVMDKRADKSVLRSVPFSVLGSATNLAKAAPSIEPSFRRDLVLNPAVLGYFLDRLPDWTSGPLPGAVVAATAHARAGQFTNVLTDLPPKASDHVAAGFLRAVALLALNDTAEPAVTQLRQTLDTASDFLPAAFYLGACYAAIGRDREAVGAWQIALVTEGDAPFVYGLIADAFLRLKETGQASRILAEATSRWPDDADLQRRAALVALALGRQADALQIVDRQLQRSPNDADALYLGARVLLDAFAAGRAIGSAADDRARLRRYGTAYIAAGGPHRGLVTQWLKTLERSPAP